MGAILVRGDSYVCKLYEIVGSNGERENDIGLEVEGEQGAIIYRV